jgi:hypothetical protein
MTIADLAIIAGLVFAWGTLSARLERFGMTAPIMFTVAGVLLTHGRLTPLGITPKQGSGEGTSRGDAGAGAVLGRFPDRGCITCERTWGCACGCCASGCRSLSAWARWPRSPCPG